MAAATSSGPVGTVQVVDPHPLNWLFIWNTMEEPVRTDEQGTSSGQRWRSSWVDETTLEVRLRKGLRYQDGEEFGRELPAGLRGGAALEGAHRRGPRSTSIPRPRLEMVDGHTVRMVFPEPDGQVLGKFEASTCRAPASGRRRIRLPQARLGRRPLVVIDTPGRGAGPCTLVEGFSSLENEIGLIQAEPLTTSGWTRAHPQRAGGAGGQPRPLEQPTRAAPGAGGVPQRPAAGRCPGADLRRRGGGRHRHRGLPGDAQRVIASSRQSWSGSTPCGCWPASSTGAPRARRYTMCGRGGPQPGRRPGPAHPGGVRRLRAPPARADPHYAVGVPAGQQPYQHDPDQARDLLTTAGWPAGRERG